MNIMVEALGLSLPYSSTALANTAERLSLAEKTGSRIVELVEKDMKPSKLSRVTIFTMPWWCC